MRVHIALFFVSLLYAILFSWAGQIMPNYLRPEAFVMLRVITATALFYLFSLTQPKDPIQWKAHGWEFAICGFFGTSANMYLFFHGLALTYPINGAILMLVTPLFVGIFDHIRLKALPKTWFVLGTLIAAAASIWLMVGKGATFTAQTLKGDLLVAINALFYAVYLVRVKKIAHIYKPITINKITFTFGTIYMLPIGLMALTQTPFHTFTPQITAKVIYILFFTSFLVYLLNSYAVKKAGPTLAGLYIYLQPVLATAIAILLGTDQLSMTKATLMLTIMAGVFLATRFSPK
jgi:drug/metabolite transporter (DMT)-like permease